MSDLAERYDALCSASADAVLELDGAGRVLAANDAACTLYATVRDEMIGRPFTRLARAHSHASPIDLAALRSPGRRIGTRLRRRDGGSIDVEIHAVYRPGSDTFLTFVRDVTARRRNARRLRDVLEFNRTILASMIDEIAILDGDGMIVAVNDAWERFARENGGDAAVAATGIGANYLEACRRSDAREVLESLQEVLAGRRPHYRTEYVSPTGEARRWFLLEAMPLRRAEGGAIVMHRDITERRRNDAELERLRTDVWHAHRVSQTGAISASLAHELNQPLAAILSNAQAGLRLMEHHAPDLDEIRAILTDIVADDKRAASVIVGLRAMLRRKETQREVLDLGRTVQEVMTFARSELIAHGVEVEQDALEECAVKADRSQILQVILNLVTNAIEAGHDQPPERRRIRVSLTGTAEGRALLAVRDWGEGIADDEKDRVFEAFWSTKPQGMGIGLPICRSISELHHGQLWFEDNRGDFGTTFFLSLPIATDA